MNSINIVDELTRVGARSIVISDNDKFIINEVHRNDVMYVCTKEEATTCVDILENRTSGAAEATFNCVVVEPSMKTRNLQKLYQLRNLREKRRLYGVAVIENTITLHNINGSQDGEVTMVVLNCAHEDFDEEQVKIGQRFCGTATFDKLLTTKITQCVEKLRDELTDLDHLSRYWLVVQFDNMSSNCSIIEFPKIYTTIATISNTVVETTIENRDTIVENDGKIQQIDSEEAEQERHLAIIDGYIEKLQKKREQAANKTTKKENVTNSKKTGWLSWLLPW